MGYHESVLDDEIQAYFSTGLSEHLEDGLKFKITKEQQKPFMETFLKHKNKQGE